MLRWLAPWFNCESSDAGEADPGCEPGLPGAEVSANSLVRILYDTRGDGMWMTVCQKCRWTSGESYLKSIADAIGKVHEEDNAGHKVVAKQVATFSSDLEGKEDSERHGPASSKS